MTIDATGCQKGIAKAIVDKNADHIFVLKSNQPSLHAEVLASFDDAAQSEAWPKLRSLILVESERTRRGTTLRERRAYISSCDEPASMLAAMVRGHWHVENKLPGVLDVTFGEDHARISRRYGAESMAVMRKLAVNPKAPNSANGASGVSHHGDFPICLAC